jgi:hypothetical protein
MKCDHSSEPSRCNTDQSDDSPLANSLSARLSGRSHVALHESPLRMHQECVEHQRLGEEPDQQDDDRPNNSADHRLVTIAVAIPAALAAGKAKKNKAPRAASGQLTLTPLMLRTYAMYAVPATSAKQPAAT